MKLVFYFSSVTNRRLLAIDLFSHLHPKVSVLSILLLFVENSAEIAVCVCVCVCANCFFCLMCVSAAKAVFICYFNVTTSLFSLLATQISKYMLLLLL